MLPVDAYSALRSVNTRLPPEEGGSQYLHLRPQALAFVRDRDSLPDTDLSRTHRQQAVIDSVIWKLKNQGTLSDLGRLTTLLGTADQYIITHKLEPARVLHPDARPERANLKFYTTPITGYATIDGQDANVINIPAVQALMKEKFRRPRGRGGQAGGQEEEGGGDPAGQYGHGGRLQRRAHARPRRPRSPRRWSRTATRPGPSATPRRRRPSRPAARCSTARARRPTRRRSPADFSATATALASLPAGHVEILLGTSSTGVPGPRPGDLEHFLREPSASSSSTSTSDNGQAGGAVTVGANAKFGIPCVY